MNGVALWPGLAAFEFVLDSPFPLKQRRPKLCGLMMCGFFLALSNDGIKIEFLFFCNWLSLSHVRLCIRDLASDWKVRA